MNVMTGGVALLERAIWGEETRSPIAAELTAWTRGFIPAALKDDAVPYLEEVRRRYKTAHAVPDPPVFSRRVRELARDFLAAPK